MTKSIDEHIAEAALKHHGAFSRHEVRPAADRTALRRRVANGSIDQLSTNVFRVAGSPRSDEQRVVAATLDLPGGAVASDLTAAWVWDIPGFALRDVHVATPRQVHRASKLAIVHHPRLWLPEHVTIVRGIPVTSLALTIYGLAGRIPRARLLWVVDRIGNQSPDTLVLLHQLLDVLAESGRNGITDMRDVLGRNPPGVRPPGSGAERRFWTLMENAGITGLRRQVDLGGHTWIGRVDVLCDETGVIFEIDSETHHSSPADIAADEARDAAMLEAGVPEVVRIWTETLWSDPAVAPRIVRATRYKYRRAA